ncbi:MAG: hypothetical protein Q8P23_02505, partial [bacterium]|nr:hypothetical protein [bacterium]
MTEPRAEPRKSDLSRYFKKSAVQGFFKLVGKQEVEVVDAEPTEDRVDHTAKGWTIGINESWDLLDYLHRAGHQKYTQYTMSDQVARIAQDPFMGRLAAPVEDARVDWLTSEFFDKPVFENHRKQVRVQLESLTENVKALPPVSGWQYVDSVKLTEVTMQLVGYMAFDLPMPALPPILQKFVEYFRDDVKKVRESGSPIDAAMLSSRMATFMGYMRQRPPQDFTLPPPPDAEKDEDSKEKSEHDKGDESGKKSDEKNEDKDEAEDKDESGKDEDKDEDDSESDESESEGKDKSDKSEDESESGDKKLDSPGDENEDESDESGDESEDDSEDEDEDEDESEGDTGDEGGLESEGGAGSDESDESDEDESESDESDDEADESDDEATSTGNLESDAPSSAPSDIPQDALDKIEKDAKDRIRNALLTMKKELTRVEKTDDALIAEMRAHPLDLGQVKIQQ